MDYFLSILARKYEHAYMVKCPSVKHSDTCWILVGHAIWRVVEKSKASDTAGTRLDLFLGFFLCFFLKIYGLTFTKHTAIPP